MKKTEEKKTKQKNWFKECFLERRFFVLVLGALLGIALFLFVKEYDLLSKVFFYSEETTENIEKKRFITNLLPVILGLPIILFLWVFRTHDTKEQLEGTNEYRTAGFPRCPAYRFLPKTKLLQNKKMFFCLVAGVFEGMDFFLEGNASP